MDVIKIEMDHKLTLCHGCLSFERKVSRIVGPPITLYFELIGDQKNDLTASRDILLCWECRALLHKLGLFQTQLKHAQYLLFGYVQSFCQEDLPNSLSKLQLYIPKEYDLEIKDDEENELFESLEELNIDNKTSIPYEVKTIDNVNNTTPYIDNRDADCFDTDDKYNMKNGKKVLKTYASLLKHVTIQKLPDIDCTDTDKFFVKVSVNHREMEDIIEKRKKRTPSPSMRHKCKNCGVGYSKRIDLLRHYTFHHTKRNPPFKCLRCSAVLKTETALANHWKKKHTILLKCTLCMAICLSKSGMVKHINKSHTKLYICNICNENYRTLQEFSGHYNGEHGHFMCDYCGRRLRQKRTLESHIRRNHLPPYCRICKRQYASYHVLHTHEKMYHSARGGKSPRELAYCVECDRQFTSVDQYKKHLRQSIKHTPKKLMQVPCPVCGKIFSRTNYMNNHYKLVHMKTSKYHCVLCDKNYVTGYALKKHTQHVHQKVPMPKDKICDLCGRGFSTNRILINHRRTHTGERPFKCKFCPATFAQQTAMHTHQKTQHKNIANLELSS